MERRAFLAAASVDLLVGGPLARLPNAQLELVDAMVNLGFPTFTLIGHDRGGRVAYRMALDHPGS